MFEVKNLTNGRHPGEAQWIHGVVRAFPQASFKVRAASYKPFDDAFTQLARDLGPKALAGDAEWERQSGQLLADLILLDWKDAVTEDGKPVAYTQELATQLLTAVDESGVGQAFRDAVYGAAQVAARRLLTWHEEVVGNSAPPSGGKSRPQTRKRG